MAFTRNGRLTGRAASDELRDQRQWLVDQRIENIKRQLAARESELLDIALELPSFIEFWETVPDYGSRRERIKLLEEFIKEK